MNAQDGNAGLKTEEDSKRHLPHCPRCGTELKQMRCRIDGPELYCPACRITFDATRPTV